MSKDPSDLSVDLYIAQLHGEETVGTAWPQINPHGHFSMAEEALKEVRAHQPSLQQLLDNL
jgi:hypothetical protein